LLARAETRLNHFIARYSERVFRNAPALALSRRLSDSWKVLGEGIVTIAADFLLFWLMLFVILPVKALSLLLSSPIRLLLDRGVRQKLPLREVTANVEGRTDVARVEFEPGDVVSAVEHTTEHLSEYQAKKRGQRDRDRRISRSTENPL
jgi:hypothetical protein